jgi:hypothetical protein
MAMISQSKVTVLPTGVEVAAGNISGLKSEGRTGQNTAVGATYESVDRIGGTRNELYVNPVTEATGQTVKIKSTSTDDTNSGSANARRVKIKGLGPNGVEQEENIFLNGTAFVTSSSNWTAIERVIVNRVGSGGDSNAGAIGVFKNDETTELLRADAGEGMGGGAFMYVPAGKNAYPSQFFVSVIEDAEVGIFVRRQGGAYGQRQVILLKNNAANYVSEAPYQLIPGDTVEVRAKRLGSSDAKVSVDIQIVTEIQ